MPVDSVSLQRRLEIVGQIVAILTELNAKEADRVCDAAMALLFEREG